VKQTSKDYLVHRQGMSVYTRDGDRTISSHLFLWLAIFVIRKFFLIFNLSCLYHGWSPLLVTWVLMKNGLFFPL